MCFNVVQVINPFKNLGKALEPLRKKAQTHNFAHNFGRYVDFQTPGYKPLAVRESELENSNGKTLCALSMKSHTHPPGAPEVGSPLPVLQLGKLEPGGR